MIYAVVFLTLILGSFIYQVISAQIPTKNPKPLSAEKIEKIFDRNNRVF